MDLTFTRFDIEINNITYKNTFHEDVKIDRTNLDEEFATFAEKFAYYSMLHELAKASELERKRELSVLYAQLDAEKRSAAMTLMVGTKLKYTETMYENEVRGDIRYITKELEYLNAKKTAGLLGACREAISHKRDMLISMGANARIGVHSEIRVHSAREILQKSGTIYDQLGEKK